MNKNSYQPMPRSGQLAKNLNLPLEDLLDRIIPFQVDRVYSYVVATVEYHQGRLYQTGSGPNFQGSLVTLCSCKHLMRTYLDTESWKGVWIAGFTSVMDMGANKLFYLMMVSQAYESHHDLWSSDSIPEETKNAKAAHLDRFGDIYKPKNGADRPHSKWHYWRYLVPSKLHVHCEPGNWQEDIKYLTQHGRRPALLVGHPEYSFLWDRPMITSPYRLPRGQKKAKLSDLFPFD